MQTVCRSGRRCCVTATGAARTGETRCHEQRSLPRFQQRERHGANIARQVSAGIEGLALETRQLRFRSTAMFTTTSVGPCSTGRRELVSRRCEHSSDTKDGELSANGTTSVAELDIVPKKRPLWRVLVALSPQLWGRPRLGS